MYHCARALLSAETTAFGVRTVTRISVVARRAKRSLRPGALFHRYSITGIVDNTRIKESSCVIGCQGPG